MSLTYLPILHSILRSRGVNSDKILGPILEDSYIASFDLTARDSNIDYVLYPLFHISLADLRTTPGNKKILKRLRRELRSRVVRFLSFSLDGSEFKNSGRWFEIDKYLNSLIRRWLLSPIPTDSQDEKLEFTIHSLFSDETLDEVIHSQDFTNYAMAHFAKPVEDQFIRNSRKLRKDLLKDLELLNIEIKILVAEIRGINLINSQ